MNAEPETIEDLHQLLRSHFKHNEFRPRQLEVVQRTLAGGHSLVLMPTGGGKSLCYQLPALAIGERFRRRERTSVSRVPLTVVLSPLIALMKDQVDAALRKGISATFINSSLKGRQRHERVEAVRAGEFDLLYVTPERFRKDEFRAALLHRDIRLLAVDEAHCISQWGHDFRPDYSRLHEIREFLGFPTTLALTATATAEVQRDIITQLGLVPTEIEIFQEGVARPNLALEVETVWDEDDKLEQLLHIATTTFAGDTKGSGIVYFTLIRTLERFSELFRQRRCQHLVYHGDLARDYRKQVQEQFLLEPQQLVLATNAFGMGIDKPDIRFVVHAELPGSLEAYCQEIGRAGRDGLPSTCRLLYDQDDLETQMEFIRWSNPDEDFMHRVHDFLMHERESIHAYGIEWLRERLHAKQKHDRRLETALGVMERYGVIEGTLQPLRITSVQPLSVELQDAAAVARKRHMAQRRLLSLVEYTRAEDRRLFLEDYFRPLEVEPLDDD